jgi:hypothetical protein
MPVPPVIDHPAVRKAADHHAAMIHQRDEARAELRKAERAKPAAVDADRDAYAKALAQGHKDPGERETAKADEAIHQAKRRAEALGGAVADAEKAVSAKVANNRKAITANLENRLTDADRAYSTAVDRWEAAAHARAQVLSAIRFLEQGDLSRPAPTVGTRLPALRVRQRGSGDPAAGYADIARAMREVVSPPEESVLPQVRVGGSNAAFLGVPDSE